MTLKFPNPLLLKTANNISISIQHVLQMYNFENLVVILISSDKLRKIAGKTCSSKDAAMRIC